MTRPTLLVAYVSTPGGEDAVALGVALARSLSADLDVCMVLPPQGPSEQVAAPSNADYEDILDEQAERWLAEAAAKIPGDVTARTRVAIHDQAASGLATEAESTGCAAIIVGGSGGGIIGRHSLGSVVNELLHVSTTPVVLTPRGIRESPEPIRRITCAVGRRPGTPPLLRATLDTCERTGAPLRLVSLVTDDDYIAPWRRDAHEETARVAAETRLTDVVAEARARLGDAYPIISTVVASRTTEDAVGSLDWSDGDFIFVGSSRLAQPLHLFFGATAAKMLRALSVPMVVVPKGA